MKKSLIIIAALCFWTGNLLAQEKAEKKIKKEVRMEDDNGVKTLTITSTSGGHVSEEVYTGEEAETKLAEMMEGQSPTDEVKKEVKVEDVNGEKMVTITTTSNGKIKEEIYTGEDADRKIKELEEGETREESLNGGKVVIKTRIEKEEKSKN